MPSPSAPPAPAPHPFLVALHVLAVGPTRGGPAGLLAVGVRDGDGSVSWWCTKDRTRWFSASVPVGADCVWIISDDVASALVEGAPLPIDAFAVRGGDEGLFRAFVSRSLDTQSPLALRLRSFE